MAAAVTVSTAGVCYATLDPKDLESDTRGVADQATCRTVDTAIVAYVALNDEDPATVAQLADYVQGDITAYRIVDGMAAGPGC